MQITSCKQLAFIANFLIWSKIIKNNLKSIIRVVFTLHLHKCYIFNFFTIFLFFLVGTNMLPHKGSWGPLNPLQEMFFETAQNPIKWEILVVLYPDQNLPKVPLFFEKIFFCTQYEISDHCAPPTPHTHTWISPHLLVQMKKKNEGKSRRNDL